MSSDDAEVYRLVTAMLERREPFATATIVRVSGSIPNAIGAKMVVAADGQRLAGTVGGGRIEFDCLATCREAINAGKSRLISAKLTDLEAGGIGMMCGGNADIYVDVHIPSPHLVLCGAGHINLALHRMAMGLGYRVTVIDDRPEWASAVNYPAATLVHARPEDVLGGLELGQNSFVVIGTRDGDLKAIISAAKTKVAYIGVVASKRKAILLGREIAAIADPAVELETLVERLHAPVGLRLGGRTPEAVALSILAEIQALRYGQAPDSMRIPPEELKRYIQGRDPSA